MTTASITERSRRIVAVAAAAYCCVGSVSSVVGSSAVQAAHHTPSSDSSAEPVIVGASDVNPTTAARRGRRIVGRELLDSSEDGRGDAIGKSGKTVNGKSGKAVDKSGKMMNKSGKTVNNDDVDDVDADVDDDYYDGNGGSPDVTYDDDDTYNDDNNSPTDISEDHSEDYNSKSSKDSKSGKSGKSSKTSKSSKSSKTSKFFKSGKDASSSQDVIQNQQTSKSSKFFKSGKDASSSQDTSNDTNAPTSAPTSTSIPDAMEAPTTSPTTNPTSNPSFLATDRPTASQPPPARCGLPLNDLREEWFNLAADISDADDLNTSGTPQRRALEWIVDGDECFGSCPDDDDATQRYIMAVYYFSTAGDGWRHCSSPSPADLINSTSPACDLTAPRIDGNFGAESSDPWLSCVHECNWGAVSCYPEGDEDGRGKKIDVIDFENNNLGGTFPSEISGLENLRYLVNEQGTTGGPLPPSWGTGLTALRVLDLDFNAITGSIPQELYGISTLIELDLDHNRISGTMSPEVGGWDRLRFMQINDNLFTGQLPSELGLLSSLVAGEFSNNFFTGTVPSELCANRDLNDGALELLITDCAGDDPKIACACCTSCRD